MCSGDGDSTREAVVCLQGTDIQLCQFRAGTAFEEVLDKCLCMTWSHRGTLLKAYSMEPLDTGAELSEGLYAFLAMELYGMHYVTHPSCSCNRCFSRKHQALRLVKHGALLLADKANLEGAKQRA